MLNTWLIVYFIDLLTPWIFHKIVYEKNIFIAHFFGLNLIWIIIPHLTCYFPDLQQSTAFVRKYVKNQNRYKRCIENSFNKLAKRFKLLQTL